MRYAYYMHCMFGYEMLTDSAFKQTYAELDWQNKEQLPIKAPENELFTVKYSEVCFDDTKRCRQICLIP